MIRFPVVAIPFLSLLVVALPGAAPAEPKGAGVSDSVPALPARERSPGSKPHLQPGGRITGQVEKSHGAFKNVDGLSVEQEVIEYQDGTDAATRKRPGRTKYNNITLKRGIMRPPPIPAGKGATGIQEGGLNDRLHKRSAPSGADDTDR